MPLDPIAAAFLTQLAQSGRPPMSTLSPPEARLSFQEFRALAGSPEEVHEIIDTTFSHGDGVTIPIRVYRPAGDGPFPVVVFFHGGGFVIGGLDSHDGSCRRMCRRGGCLVVAVDYRLAPENKFPAATEDAYAAVCWAARHIAEFGGDPTRIAVAGDSAGGNLAAVATHRAKAEGFPTLTAQVLVYPVTNFRHETQSYIENGKGYLLTQDMMHWFEGHYLTSDTDPVDPRHSPLRNSDFSGLPPALVVTAEFDPLRDEGREYADKLREAGVPTIYTCFDGLFHGFWQLNALLPGATSLDETIGHFLKENFRS